MEEMETDAFTAFYNDLIFSLLWYLLNDNFQSPSLSSFST